MFIYNNITCSTGAPTYGSKIGPGSSFHRPGSSYKATNISRSDDVITANLLSSDSRAISPLFLSISCETAARLRIRITDPTEERYEVPYPWKSGDGVRGDKRRYRITVQNETFSIQVTRLSDNTVIFDTSSHDLVYTDQFLSLGTRLPSDKLYGIGENSAPILRDLNQKRHTLWNAGGYYEQGQGVNLYGSHPFYLNLEKSGSANGVLLMNSNAMDILLTDTPAVTWNTIGGILDFSVFVGDSPVDVIKLYTGRIGRSFLPPIWALGFHLCRWGYNNTGYMRSVLDDMVDQGVPVDVQWNDIDYMDRHKDFTIDPDRYGDLPQHVDYLHSVGKRYVAMIDPGILAKFNQGYLPADTGVQEGIFIRNSTGQLLIGNVWPGDTVFPDFLSRKTWQWWSKWILYLNNEFQQNFDGIWIDMNEPQSFYDGSKEGCPWHDRLEDPPYIPGIRRSLQWGTLCLTAKQGKYLHYDVHNLYGWSEAQATRFALKELRPQNRTFILSRSTFVGSGQWTAHWTGDVHSTWGDLKASVSDIINMNILGIPMVGADICGFEGDSDKELCIRWSQLGAYYPFSRNHNTLYARPQEPTAWGTDTTAVIRAALQERYHLMLYMYGLFVKSHAQGDPVVQGLFMQFPTDTFSHDKDRQFLWGAGVMVCPCLERGARTTWIYFPQALWYHIWTIELVSKGGEVIPDYPSPLGSINVFVRGGTIIPMVTWASSQTPTAEAMLATKSISLYCYLDSAGSAAGEIFVDDGYSEDPSRDAHKAEFSVSDRRLVISPTSSGSGEFVKDVVSVLVGGVKGDSVSNVYLNDSKTDFKFTGVVLQIPLEGKGVRTGERTTITWDVKG